MPVKSRIVYDPTLSVEENAKKCGVSDNAIRYYIRTRGIDRRYHGSLNTIEELKAYLKEHPNATRAELAKETGHGINTIRRYWDAAHERTNTEQFKKSSIIKFTRTRLDKAIKDPSKIANRQPLASELLKEASDIIKFAEQADTSRFREWLLRDRIRPLICLGNGGKHTTYPALLYQMMSSIGKSATPLEFATMSPEAIGNSKVLILSNGGANPDIKYATKRAAKYNKDNTACFTFTDTDDNIMVKTFGLEQSFVFKNDFYDGFISIRSKILTYALLYKAFSGDASFADKIRGIGHYKVEINKKGSLPRWSNINHFTVLYGSYGEPVAHDIESTMVEGGIASVQLTDYRNFCHGRFIFGSNHCANKKVKTTDVCTILLISPREEKIAREIREKALPDNMPVVEIRTELDNPLATIQLLIDALTFVFNVAERCFDINPNSPKNYSSIDKRIPKNSIPFAQELSRLGELHYDIGTKSVKPQQHSEPKTEQAKVDTIKPDTVVIKEDKPKPAKVKSDKKAKKSKRKTREDKVAAAIKKQKAKVNSTIRCTDDYVYFYQNTPLSNWWVSEPSIEYDNHTFTSSEALFMYLKAKLFRDDYMAEVIAPSFYDEAKALGSIVRDFDEAIWERERENAMYIALKAKVAVDEAYRETLLSEEYRNKIFVEASPSDEIWGIQLSIKDASEGKKWDGLNLLGNLHTIIRDELLGLREPQNREIKPISDEEFTAVQLKIENKRKKKAKTPPSKNKYATDGVLIRSVLGGCIGDISGSSREGYSRNAKAVSKVLTASSYFTDDTTMIVAVAEWLKNKDKASLKDTMIKWYNRYPYVGFGGKFQDFAKTGEGQPSNANGGAMRVAPCAIFAKTLNEALKLAEEQCIVSHTTQEAIDGAKAIAASVFLAKGGVSKGKTDKEIKAEIKSYVEKEFGYDLNKTLGEIQRRSEELQFQKALFNIAGIEAPNYQNMSKASLSCPMAIRAFLYGENYEAAIRYALAMGGDSDTIAAMAGAISAQVYGIPKALVDEALVYLPSEMIEVLDEFEPDNTFVPTGITPPEIEKWTNGDVIVYGSGIGKYEDGRFETVYSSRNKYPKNGYPIPTFEKTIEEIRSNVAAFIEYAKQHPELRFHVRKVGYDKAGYKVEQIAPLFKEARAVKNILLPKAMVDILN